jgi:hypothetical protein
VFPSPLYWPILAPTVLQVLRDPLNNPFDGVLESLQVLCTLMSRRLGKVNPVGVERSLELFEQIPGTGAGHILASGICLAGPLSSPCQKSKELRPVPPLGRGFVACFRPFSLSPPK